MILFVKDNKKQKPGIPYQGQESLFILWILKLLKNVNWGDKWSLINIVINRNNKSSK